MFSVALGSMACLRVQEVSLFSLPLFSARVLEVSKRPFSSLAHGENCLPQFGTSFSEKLSPHDICLQPGTSQSVYPYMSIQSSPEGIFVFACGDISHYILSFIFRLFHLSLILSFHHPRKRVPFLTSHIWRWR